MYFCAVCGKSAGTFSGEIIQGLSGDRVCKDCLRKANIGIMKFSFQNIPASEIKKIVNPIIFEGEEEEESENSSKQVYYQNPSYINSRTIICRTCGARISPRARRCPHCGEMTPMETAGQVLKGILLAPLLFIVILIAIGFYIGFFRMF